MLEPLQLIQQLAEALMKRYGLIEKGWSFGFNHRTRSVGVCHYRTKRIELSLHHAEQSDLTEIIDTIKHEIAHAVLPPGEGHGSLWKAACLMIGARPERCYQGPEIDMSRWVGTCPSCGHMFKRVSKPKRQFSCHKCDDKFNRDFLIILKRKPKNV